MIIACLGLKGGTGKTTLATNLAAGFAANPKERVLLLDTDEQASSARWNIERPPDRPLVKTLQLPDAGGVKAQYADFESKFSKVIIDGSPRVDKLSTVTLGVADMALLPVQASPLDIWATEPLVERIHKVQEIKPFFAAAFLLNRFNPNTLISKSAASALESLGLPIMSTSFGQRVAYSEAATMGLSVLEYTDRKAAAEVRSALEEIQNMLKH